MKTNIANYHMVLSIGVVALNEERYLPQLLSDLTSQSYRHDMIEIVFIDSGSTDLTKQLMLDFKKNNESDFKDIVVLDNPSKTQASGWNVAIRNFKGNALSRIDAHSRIDKDFCKYVVENLEEGEYVVGGKRPSLCCDDSSWSKTLLQVENSLFGSSVLKSRSSEKKQYVKTLFHATYKREVFDKVGLFNEVLLRTEDNEYHYRVRKAGFNILFDPRIVSFQFARNNFRKMIKQKYGNGLWIGKTLKFCPKCLSIYHFVPFCFVIGIITSTILIFFSFWYLAALIWGLYFLFAISNTIASGIKDRFYKHHLVMPFLFLVLHLSYGIGTLIGIFSFRNKLTLNKK